MRNLAQRAATAAGETDALIQKSADAIGEGAGIVSRTCESFATMNEYAGKLENLKSIAGASSEQMTAVGGVAESMNGINDLTQVSKDNTGNTQQMAVRMQEQAEGLRSYVGELMGVVNGRKKQ